jgi:hypothetical protein
MSEDLGVPQPWRANAPSWAGANWDRANGAWHEDICGFDLGDGWVCAMGSHAGPHTHMMTPEWSSPTCVAQAMSRRYHPRVRREDVAWGLGELPAEDL